MAALATAPSPDRARSFQPAAFPSFAPGSTARQVASFAAIGVVSTAAYAAIYTGLRLAMDPAHANALALVITAVGNTAANRHLTFAVRGRAGALRDQVGGLIAFGIALAITTAAVAATEAAVPGASRLTELTILVASNALATVCRFLLLRRWIARDRRPFTPHQDGAPS